MSIYETETLRPLRYTVDYHVEDKIKACFEIDQITYDSIRQGIRKTLWSHQVYINGERCHFSLVKKILVGMCELLFPDDKEKERELKKSFIQSCKSGITRCGDRLSFNTGVFLWDKSLSIPTKEDLQEKLEPEFCSLSPYYPTQDTLMCMFGVKLKPRADKLLLTVFESDEEDRGANVIYEHKFPLCSESNRLKFVQGIYDRLYELIPWMITQEVIFPTITSATDKDGKEIYRSTSPMPWFNLPREVLEEKKELIRCTMEKEASRIFVLLTGVNL